MSTEDLQFDKAEFEEGPGSPTACGACQQPIADEHWLAGDVPVCPSCRLALAARGQGGSGAGRFLRALVLGMGAGVLGAGLYFLVLKLTGYEIGLIAIAVGFLVGAGVRAGAHGRGGWVYQLMAVGITYLAIVSTYVPFIRAQIGEEASGISAWVFASVLAIPSPFLSGFSNLIGLLIIGFALYQAWRMNARLRLALSGPHRSPPAVPAPSALPPADPADGA